MVTSRQEGFLPQSPSLRTPRRALPPPKPKPFASGTEHQDWDSFGRAAGEAGRVPMLNATVGWLAFWVTCSFYGSKTQQWSIFCLASSLRLFRISNHSVSCLNNDIQRANVGILTHRCRVLLGLQLFCV